MNWKDYIIELIAYDMRCRDDCKTYKKILCIEVFYLYLFFCFINFYDYFL